MRFSLRFNNDLPASKYIRLAQAAEAAGFDQFWISHDLFWRHAWTILGAIATATRRIHIGVGIANPYTQHVSDIAMAAATLDELSGGRALLGFGAGAADFLRWVGIDQTVPLAVVRESLLAFDRLFQKSPVSLPRWTPEAYLRFPTRRIPVYLGAMSPKMTRLIGSLADGGLPLLLPPEQFSEVMGQVEAGAAEAGRSLDEIDVAACVWCSVSADRAAARTALQAKIAYYGHAFSASLLARVGLTHADFVEIERLVQTEHNLAAASDLVTDQMLQLGMVGTAADLIPRLEGLAARGARHLSFGPPLGPDPLEAIVALGREVLPHFR